MTVDTMAKEQQEHKSKKVQVEELEKELDEARAKADEYLDMARHVKADFENYRRRTEQEA